MVRSRPVAWLPRAAFSPTVLRIAGCSSSDKTTLANAKLHVYCADYGPKKNGPDCRSNPDRR